jgi:hypothetical protein
MESMRPTSRVVRSRRTVYLRLLALFWLLECIAGCETPHHNQRRCEPVGLGFTPTRWTCWQDGAMAYRIFPNVRGAEFEDVDPTHAERGPIRKAPAAELVAPGPEDEKSHKSTKPIPNSR